MKTVFDDLATALVSATLCLAAVSMFIVVFASVTWESRRVLLTDRPPGMSSQTGSAATRPDVAGLSAPRNYER